MRSIELVFFDEGMYLPFGALEIIALRLWVEREDEAKPRALTNAAQFS